MAEKREIRGRKNINTSGVVIDREKSLVHCRPQPITSMLIMALDWTVDDIDVVIWIVIPPSRYNGYLILRHRNSDKQGSTHMKWQ